MGQGLQKLDAASSVIAGISNVSANCILCFSVIILLVQVVLRFVFTIGVTWIEETSKFCMIWVTMLLGNVLIKDRELIRVDFFDSFWPKRWLFYREIFYELCLLFLLWVLIKEGINQAVHGLGQTTTALRISWFWPYLSIPIGAGFMLCQVLVNILKQVLKGEEK